MKRYSTIAAPVTAQPNMAPSQKRMRCWSFRFIHSFVCRSLHDSRYLLFHSGLQRARLHARSSLRRASCAACQSWCTDKSHGLYISCSCSLLSYVINLSSHRRLCPILYTTDRENAEHIAQSKSRIIPQLHFRVQMQSNTASKSYIVRFKNKAGGFAVAEEVVDPACFFWPLRILCFVGNLDNAFKPLARYFDGVFGGHRSASFCFATLTSVSSIAAI